MLIQTISQYLGSHKRLVIPQLGTFIVKEPGVSIVFSELLKRDDGVLRGLLAEEGMTEIEAAGEIDRLVFEVRHAMESGIGHRLDGLGVMKPGPNGTIVFEYDPVAAEPARTAPEVSDPDAPKSHLRPETIAEAVKNAFPERAVSPSARLNPEPSLRGLRYGKPPKNTNAYTYVNGKRRRGVDRFLLVAVIAAVVAVAAIAFGYFRQSRDKQAEAEQTVQTDSLQASPRQSEQPN